MADDYEKRKLERLERYEGATRQLVRTMDNCLTWIWVLILVGCPVAIYFKPLPQESATQAILSGVVLAFALIVSIAWRAVGKIEN